MDFYRVKHTGFTSVDGDCGRLRGRAKKNSVPSSRKRRRRAGSGVYAGSMIAKFAICAAACAFVLIFKLAQDAKTVEVMDTGTQETPVETTEESIGKLKFVELPSILEVFSSSALYKMPVSYKSLALSEDETMLSLEADAAQDVSATFSGYVKEFDTKSELGGYVCVLTAEDKEIAFFGIDDICVEKGQTLRNGDRMGKAPAGGRVYISVKENGRPMNPLEHFEAAGSSRA